MPQKQQKSYVYAHYIRSESGVKSPADIFYIGKGTVKRAMEKRRVGNKAYAAIVAKYGKENILVGKVQCESGEEAFRLERVYIQRAKELGAVLVNMNNGGGGPIEMSAEARQKCSVAHKGITTWNKGIPHSDETKIKMSEAKKDYVPWNKGVPMSDEAKNKLSVSRSGKSHSEETKKKLAIACSGWHQTEETKKKISDAAKARHAKRKLIEAGNDNV